MALTTKDGSELNENCRLTNYAAYYIIKLNKIIRMETIKFNSIKWANLMKIKDAKLRG